MIISLSLVICSSCLRSVHEQLYMSLGCMMLCNTLAGIARNMLHVFILLCDIYTCQDQVEATIPSSMGLIHVPRYCQRPSCRSLDPLPGHGLR